MKAPRPCINQLGSSALAPWARLSHKVALSRRLGHGIQVKIGLRIDFGVSSYYVHAPGRGKGYHFKLLAYSIQALNVVLFIFPGDIT